VGHFGDPVAPAGPLGENAPVRRRHLVSIALAMAGLGVGAVPARAEFTSCGRQVLCGHVTVPLDRSGTVPGSVTLLVERTLPRGGARAAPVLALSGGPGQASVSARSDFADLLAPVLDRRELIVFDQRGTGRSGVLRCPTLQRAGQTEQQNAAAECADQLGPARAFYTTRDSIEDIEAVRQAVGADRISLYGVSYGTKVALGYAVAHPDHVDRLVLDSTVSLTGPDPFALSTFAALPGALRADCGRGACAGITRDPVGDVAELAARLRARPLTGVVFGSRGQRVHTQLDETGLFDLLVAGDLDPTLMGAAPAAVVAALHGDQAPVLRLARRANQVENTDDPTELSVGLFAATICEESPFPWARTASPDERFAAAQSTLDSVPGEALLPFDRQTAYADSAAQLCLRWPEAPDAPTIATGPPPATPTLIYSGTRDTRTPLPDAVSVAGSLPDARIVTVSGVGHSVLGASLSDCPLLQLDRFFGGRATATHCNGLQTRDGFLQSIAALFSPRVYPVPPTSVSQLLPARGVRGKRGRTATAALLTFIDAFPTVLSNVLLQDPAMVERGGARVGGLRGGHYTLRGDRLELHRVVYVPGVVVSGTIRFVGSSGLDARFRIAGPAASHGIVAIDERLVMHGRLGGRSFRSRPRGRVSSARAGAGPAAPLRTAAALRQPARLAQTARSLKRAACSSFSASRALVRSTICATRSSASR
jgi:pimeloyl-ACP methyl ester carboxylesterase